MNRIAPLTIRWLLPIAALIVCTPTVCSQTNSAVSAAAISERLDALKHTIAAEVSTELQRSNLTASYTVVWRAYEDAVIAALKKILPEQIPALTTNHFDAGKTGREKNRLADFAIRCDRDVIEISIKAARASANPENDLGTFHDHANRERQFAASFTLWARYDDTTPAVRCDRAFFDRTWRFTGKSTLVDGVKYRNKDGNMRPKPWAMFDSGEACWETKEAFEAAVKRAAAYRANQVVQERLADLSEDDQRELYRQLRARFDSNAPPVSRLP